jgi:signal transduction histidine kinase
MGRLIDNADRFRYSSEVIQTRHTLTYLLNDVIIPSIKQVDLLLRERRFSLEKIEYDKELFQRFPPLWVDRLGFQQVMFNLLSNSIKYAYDDPDSFRVEIIADLEKLDIRFQDYGLGIEEQMKEVIFEEGIRGQKATKMKVAGQGLGLWVSRQIIEAHGGKIWVSKYKHPTEFTISLPCELLSRPNS